MSLLQKRWLQKVETSAATATKNIKEKTGLDITVAVDTDSFPDDEEVRNDFFYHEIYGLTSAIDALTIISKDTLGRQALQEQIKKMTLHNTAKNFKDEGSKSVKIEADTLNIYSAYNFNSNNLYRPEQLAKEIENLL